MRVARIGSPLKRSSVFLLGIVTLVLITLGAAHAVEPTSGISFAQVSFTSPSQPYSRYGKVVVVSGTLYGDGFINIERYENGVARRWIVKNLPVVNGALPSGASTMFDLGATGRQYSFTAYVDYSPTPLADDSSLAGKVPLAYLLKQEVLPAGDNPNAFEDVVCHKDDKKFWAGQGSVVSLLIAVNRDQLIYKNGTGWIIKGKDPTKVLMITASHNFTDAEAQETSVAVKYQRTECGGKKNEDFWSGEIDAVLEKNPRYDFVIVSLKKAPEGRMFPPPLQALYKEIKLDDVVSIPQHPAEVIPYKQGGYYYDIANQKRCYIAPTAVINKGDYLLDSPTVLAYSFACGEQDHERT